MGILTFYDNFRRRIGSLHLGGFTDAILLVEGVEIPVHKCILAAQSEYFSHLFSPKNDSQEATGSQDIVELGDISDYNTSLKEFSDLITPLANNVFQFKNTKVEVVRAVLDYFYRGEYNYDDNVETHWQALELAHQFQLRDLEEILIKNLVKSITVENFVYFHNKKMRYENVQLENSCHNFLKRNGEEIAKSDNFTLLTRDSLLSLLEAESFGAAERNIFRAAERWSGVNKPNQETLKQIVEKIRLATMSQKDLFDFVSTSNELPSIDIMEPIRRITNKDAASTNFRQQQSLLEINILGDEVLSGSVTLEDFISGSSGCTFHRVGGKADCVAVKLDKIYRLNALDFLLDSTEGRSYKYHVKVSVDGEKWEKVADHSNYWCRSHQFIRFDPRPVKFVIITGTEEDLKIVSIKAMFTDEECSLVQGILVASTNVALESRGATVTGINDEYYKPINCIDVDEDPYTSYTYMHENFPITIKLGQPYWLSSVGMEIHAQRNSYTIESSTDGESWQPVGGETEGEEEPVRRTFEFSRRVVLHFRFTMKQFVEFDDSVTLLHFESPARTPAVTN